MRSGKIYIFLCICILIGLILIALIPGKNVAQIENAAINPENGDIAFTYFYHERSTIVLALYNANGEALFSTGIDSDGGSYSTMTFNGENLCIYISRTNILYEFSRDGTQVKKSEMPREQVDMPDLWHGWDPMRGKKQFEQNGYLYVYEYSTFPQYLSKETHQLLIIGPDGSITTIYFKESKK